MTPAPAHATVLTPHPLSQLYPPLPLKEYAALVGSIREHGLRTPITLYEGQVLDGWHRYRACTEVDVPVRSTDFRGTFEQALAFVQDVNETRRHLNESQRALVAARIVSMTASRSAAPRGATIPQAADAARVSPRTVNRAKLVLAKATKAEIAAIEAGKVSVKAVARKITARTPAPLVLTSTRGVVEPKRSVAAPSYSLEAWSALGAEERADLITVGRTARSEQFNAQKTDDIEWAQWSWNPVTGCKHDCPYCYARDIAERIYPQKFAPSVWPARLGAPGRTPMPPQAKREIAFRNVFTCSMADLFGRWVPADWIQAVLNVVAAAPQWNFLFLTKFPKRYAEFAFPPNAWVGATVDCQARVAATEEAFANVEATVKWLSIEPMLEPLRFKQLDRFQWLVLGGASPSKLTPEWRVPASWWVPLHAEAARLGLQVFHKSNLFVRERRWPRDGGRAPSCPPAFDYLRRKAPADIVRGER